MSSAVSSSSPSSSSRTLSHHYLKLHHSPLSSKLNLHFKFPNYPSPPTTLQLTSSSRRIHSIADDHRKWSRSINSDILSSNNDDDDEDEEEEEDRSLDLLVRFIENVFKKVSKRARKAVRSVLPPSISTKLVGFSVNGVLVLAFLWVLKAFLEVICTLGSAVFVSILLIRVIWSAVAYLQESRSFKANVLDDDHRVWTGSQPAT